MVVEIAPGAAGVPGVPRTGRQAGCEAATAVRREVLDDALAKKPAKVRRAAGRQAVAVAGREGRGWRGAGGERARARVRAHRGRASGRTSWVNTTWSRRC